MTELSFIAEESIILCGIQQLSPTRIPGEYFL